MTSLCCQNILNRSETDSFTLQIFPYNKRLTTTGSSRTNHGSAGVLVGSNRQVTQAPQYSHESKLKSKAPLPMPDSRAFPPGDCPSSIISSFVGVCTLRLLPVPSLPGISLNFRQLPDAIVPLKKQPPFRLWRAELLAISESHHRFLVLSSPGTQGTDH